MAPPPQMLDGARVVWYAILDDTVTPTGRTVHRVNGKLVGPAAALAICRYDGEKCVWLYLR
jgi:hypothetical protein